MGDANFVVFESSKDDVKSVTTDLEFIGGITGNDNLIIKRGGINLGNSLVISTINLGASS